MMKMIPLDTKIGLIILKYRPGYYDVSVRYKGSNYTVTNFMKEFNEELSTMDKNRIREYVRIISNGEKDIRS